MLRRGKILFKFMMLILVLAAANEGLAQSRGGVKGVLKDAQSGDPLIYANVALAGTTFGVRFLSAYYDYTFGDLKK